MVERPARGIIIGLLLTILLVVGWALTARAHHGGIPHEGGQNGPNVVVGTQRDDPRESGIKLLGGHGPDIIRGLAGDDRLIGGKGKDVLRGGPGFDVCWAIRGPGGNGDQFFGCEVIKRTR